MDVGISKAVHDALAIVGAPLERAYSLPSAFYTDPEVFEAERQSCLRDGWIFAGREEQVESVGTYRVLETANGSVILIRDEDRVLRAFANVCRHRGSALMEGEGRCRRIVCPYHAWSYHLDGRLAKAPDMEKAEGFDTRQHGLVSVRLVRWAGFVFLNFDEDAPSLKEHLGDLPDRMASHRLQEMHHCWSIELDCACNWKLILENAMETYHTGTVHRETVGAQTSRVVPTKGEWLCIQVLSRRSIATLPDAPPSLPVIEGLDADAMQGTYFTVIHPTCQLVMAQDCLWWLNVVPRAHNRSLLEIGGCFPRYSIELPDFSQRAQPYLDRWEAVGREDVGILEQQQTALGSVLHRPGRLSHRDEQVRALNLWVLNKLAAFAES